MNIRKFYGLMLLAIAASLSAECCRFEVDSLKADLLEMKELVGCMVETPALDGFISGVLEGDAEVIKAALHDAVACVAAAKDVLTDEQIVAYANKLETYWAERGEARAPRPPFIDPAEGQLAPNELTYFPRDVFIARNLEVGGDATIDGNLTVDGDVNINTSNVSFIDNTNAASFNCLDFKKSRAGNIVQNGDSIGCLNFQGFDGSTFVSGALIEAHVDGAPGAGDMPGRIIFLTSPDGTDVPTEKMRINNAGVVSLTNNLDMPDTSDAATGVVTKAGTRFIHNFGINNTFLGVAAGNTTMTSGAAWNTGVGVNALAGLSTGNSNVGIGYGALAHVSSGIENTALGAFALNDLVSSGGNTAVGNGALAFLTLGGGNTALGSQAGGGTSCQGGTFIGYATTNTLYGLTNTTALGYGAACIDSNQVTLGNAFVTTLRCAQTTITAISDRREKKNIVPIVLGLDFIRRLKPVKFHRIHQQDNEPLTYGLIAQDVIEVLNEVGEPLEAFAGVSYDSAHDRYELRFGEFQMIALKAIQELAEKYEQSLKATQELAEKVTVLEKELADLRSL